MWRAMFFFIKSRDFGFLLPFLFAGVCAMKKGSPEEKKRVLRDFLGVFGRFGRFRVRARDTHSGNLPHARDTRQRVYARDAGSGNLPLGYTRAIDILGIPRAPIRAYNACAIRKDKHFRRNFGKIPIAPCAYYIYARAMRRAMRRAIRNSDRGIQENLGGRGGITRARWKEEGGVGLGRGGRVGWQILGRRKSKGGVFRPPPCLAAYRIPISRSASSITSSSHIATSYSRWSS